MDTMQEKRVKRLFDQRINDEITGVELLKLLDVSQANNGAGLRREDAKHLVKDLELILLLRYKQ